MGVINGVIILSQICNKGTAINPCTVSFDI